MCEEFYRTGDHAPDLKFQDPPLMKVLYYLPEREFSFKQI